VGPHFVLFFILGFFCYAWAIFFERGFMVKTAHSTQRHDCLCTRDKM